MFDLTNPIYSDAAKARAYLETIQWPNGPVCPHCGNVDSATIGKIEGVKQSHRDGLYYCGACKDQFTVTVGTVMERSHIPLNKWVLAAHLMAASKKGVSGHQLMRTLGVTYKTAWFLAHRLREAMRVGELPPMGGAGKTLEADTTYIGGREPNKHKNKRHSIGGGHGKAIVHTLVERGGGARSHHVPSVNGKTLRPILNKHADRASAFNTDTAGGYYHVGKEFASHGMVDHGADEYVRGEVH